MYLYIYTVYVIVEYEMWLLHFIFEGLFVYFFKTAGKCYIKTEYDGDGDGGEREEKRNDQKLPRSNQKMEKSNSTDCI